MCVRVCVQACNAHLCAYVCVYICVYDIDVRVLYTAKINETSTFGPADDDITFDYDGDDYGDDNDEEDIDAVSNLTFIMYRIPYTWKFSRHVIFTVFAGTEATVKFYHVKIKIHEHFK